MLNFHESCSKCVVSALPAELQECRSLLPEGSQCVLPVALYICTGIAVACLLLLLLPVHCRNCYWLALLITLLTLDCW